MKNANGAKTVQFWYKTGPVFTFLSSSASPRKVPQACATQNTQRVWVPSPQRGLFSAISTIRWFKLTATSPPPRPLATLRHPSQPQNTQEAGIPSPQQGGPSLRHPN